MLDDAVTLAPLSTFKPHVIEVYHVIILRNDITELHYAFLLQNHITE